MLIVHGSLFPPGRLLIGSRRVHRSRLASVTGVGCIETKLSNPLLLESCRGPAMNLLLRWGAELQQRLAFVSGRCADMPDTLGKGAGPYPDKDPRLCLTYPAYQHIFLKRTPIAAVIRHPIEVAGSLQARDMIPIAKGLIIWFLYNQHLSRSLIESDVLVGYQSIIDLEEKAIHALSAFISSNIHEINCRPDSIESILSRKVQPDWKRSNKEFSHNFLPEIEWQEIAKTCNEIYQKISSSGFKVSQLQSSFANTPEAILRGCAVLGWQKMPAIPEDLTSKLQAAQFEIDKLKNSRSWKMTAPLRWLADIAKNSK